MYTEKRIADMSVKSFFSSQLLFEGFTCIKFHVYFYYLPLSEHLKHLNYRKKVKDFAETYFRGSTESKLFTKSYFRGNGQNPRNPGKFSSLM